MIKKRLRTTQSRQRSYVDKRRWSIEFREGNHVFLKVTSTTGIGKMRKSKELTSQFIDP